MAELKTINLQGDEIPILCTMAVLSEIQDEFGSLSAFSDKLAPTIKDEDGITKTDKNGNPIFSGAMPDIHAIVFSLPKFIQNGIEVYNKEHKIKIPTMTKTEIWQRNENSVYATAAVIYGEFMRSVYAPKQQPSTEAEK